MVVISTFFFVVVVFLVSLSPSSSSSVICQLLKSNGFPIGLVPKESIMAFSVDHDGTFKFRLREPCTTRFENNVRYETNITGTIRYGQISDLRGVYAQELFLWFPVKGVKVDIPTSGIIYFDIGVIFKQLSFSLFDIPPDCHRYVEEEEEIRRWGLSDGDAFLGSDDIAGNPGEVSFTLSPLSFFS